MAHGSVNTLEVVAPKSKFYQGPFGRVASDLPAWFPPSVKPDEVDKFLLDIANAEMIEAPGKSPTEAAKEESNDSNANSSNIPAGYTYLGQFIDHDITFDPASSLMRRNDPAGLLNHRTPRLDLDCLYGRGPAASPYLYDQKTPVKKADGSDEIGLFLIGNVEGSRLPDLPRNSAKTALIGDPRNDENAIVAQLHLAFLLAHNALVRRAETSKSPQPFEESRRVLNWLYQHVVWNDFVKRISSEKTRRAALQKILTPDGRSRWELGLKDIYEWKNSPFIPVEFSAAAYRFGHSMVRNAYQTNQPHRGFGNFVPIFDSTAPGDENLRGFRELNKANYIQWDWFLRASSSSSPFPQVARKIDTKLANSLAALHESNTNNLMNILAFRNLKRGLSFELPSGSSVARKFGIAPMKIDPDRDSLWFYVLKEAESLPGGNAGNQLGPLGSAIVCAVLGGLLLGDPNSYLNINPDWSPDDEPLLDQALKADNKEWDLMSIIRLSGLPVDAKDFDQFDLVA